MKAQWFRLQSILDLRASALEDAKNTLQHALAELAAAQLACDQARQEADAVANQICSATRIQTASQSQGTRESYHYLTRQVQNLKDRILECQNTVQTCRMQVVKASREHEIIVRLREKWLKVGQYLEARKEENLLNDLINSQRFQTQSQSREEYLQT